MRFMIYLMIATMLVSTLLVGISFF
ncbi:stressosome-associated protein Prli42 [Massilibacterium senegalense]|nr:stressosome-associated protein Prli42 [Massilibacterium senegalense]